MTATCALTLRMVKRNELPASYDVLLHRGGDMNTNLTDRKEVNVQ
jgi:hypothetical protein